ncbi:MAG: protein phosphatase 2C domain-containing protein [Aggregatilineales bacterium]
MAAPSVIPPIITIPQVCETPARRDLAPGNVAFTYVYARSRDTQQANAPGQDFIAYRYDSNRIAFAVCDGVSQSFYGDLAARFLGTRLVEWLWDWTPGGEVDFVTDLNLALSSWTTDATALVQAKVIRADLPEMQKVALERKRTYGSESMFVAGLIDRRVKNIALCWMGDMRLWLWDSAGESIELPKALWKTRERWSSRVGPKHSAAHGCILPLGKIARITAHSDGVGRFADSFGKLAQDQLDPMVAELLEAPANDDVSVLDINLTTQPEYGPWQTLATPNNVSDPSEPVLTWDAVPFAGRYRVSIDDGALPYSREVPSDIRTTRYTFFLPDVLGKTLTCAVQALNDYALPSQWSVPITFSAEGKVALVAVPLESPASKTQPKRPKSKRPRRRTQSCLIVIISALILTVLIVAAWIVAALLLWNSSILDAMQRM